MCTVLWISKYLKKILYLFISPPPRLYECVDTCHSVVCSDLRTVWKSVLLPACGTPGIELKLSVLDITYWATLPFTIYLFFILEYLWPILGWNYRCRAHIYGWLTRYGIHFINMRKGIHRRVLCLTFLSFSPRPKWSQLFDTAHL